MQMSRKYSTTLQQHCNNVAATLQQHWLEEQVQMSKKGWWGQVGGVKAVGRVMAPTATTLHQHCNNNATTLTCVVRSWRTRNVRVWRWAGVQHIATHKHCNTLQHTATALQRATTRCNTRNVSVEVSGGATYCNTQTLQHSATHCNILQHAATRCNTMQHKDC